MLLKYILIGYVALYSVIWLHEVGHGIMYAKYKCKENPFKVHVPFYLFFSTPKPVDVDQAKTLSVKQIYNVGIGGIVVNLLFGIPIFIFLLLVDFENTLLMYFIFSFALFHLVEAASYMVISNIFLSSDMVLVQQYNPKLRIPIFILGLLIVGLIIYMIIICPESWRLGYVISIGIMTLCMCLGRVIFSRINKFS
ncbi:hypothetical protein [Lysinibacillus fusiformis]|uniref:hypothetical protein n=1 Tax=Lysinibacillus fusiformis TaxID=28031 RepID=UPI00187EA652|nr:hypothetical protein [Lysinibacillus fusiformis]MBD8521266.1 hypothetical protein [Lysinibacillus fusiformis]